MKPKKPPAEPLEFPRADPAALARFDASTKACTMNCGPSTADPRDWRERRYLCDDCLTLDNTTDDRAGTGPVHE